MRGQFEAWKRHGRLEWKRLVQPAIDLAKNGFKASKALDDALKTTKGIEEDIRNDPGLRSEIFIIAVWRRQSVYTKTVDSVKGAL